MNKKQTICAVSECKEKAVYSVNKGVRICGFHKKQLWRTEFSQWIDNTMSAFGDNKDALDGRP